MLSANELKDEIIEVLINTKGTGSTRDWNAKVAVEICKIMEREIIKLNNLRSHSACLSMVNATSFACHTQAPADNRS